MTSRSLFSESRLSSAGDALVSFMRRSLSGRLREPVLLHSPLRWVYLPWKRRRMMRRCPVDHICQKGVTRICIEGYPRSANTFAGRLFHLANPVPIAHHTHLINNVKLALRYGIPVLILIRDPIDAIASACIYRKQGVDSEVSWWLSFYQYVEQVKDRVVLADFQQVTGDFNSVIASLNGKFNTDFNLVEDLEAAREQVFEGIKEYAARLGRGSDKIPMPVAEREEAKAKYRALVSKHASIGIAQDLYARLAPKHSKKDVVRRSSRPGCHPADPVV